RAAGDRGAALKKAGLDSSKPAIALLPGSRHAEVSRHLPVMREAAMGLRREREIQFFCVCASTIDPKDLVTGLANPAVQIPVVHEDRYEAIGAADLVWTASGTATLETALLGRPMIIIYRLAWITYMIARLLVRVEHIGMANLIAGERLVPELIQRDANPERIIAESRILLDDAPVRSGIMAKLAKLRERLGGEGAADRVAALALGMMR
ncbi:MAG TPA: lipid-A-disaccharide synthase, partial [Candidatus Binatia bacterium]|nr:lipid-A-disaccharide synthase [Candidatus Binatia bacterium]